MEDFDLTFSLGIWQGDEKGVNSRKSTPIPYPDDGLLWAESGFFITLLDWNGCQGSSRVL